MATCSTSSVLQHTLENGTRLSFCGLPFDERQTCGFLKKEESIGVQLCCALTESIETSEAICQYTIGARIGQLIEILASFATAIAVGGLLVYAVNRKLRARWMQRMRRNQGQQVIDAVDSRLFMNLMVAEFIQALGNFFTIKWIARGLIVDGDPVCTAQAAIKQVGIVGSALTSLAICVQTFYALVLRWPIKKAHSRWMIIVIWLWVVLNIMIPNLVHRNAQKRYYGSTGFWCWIDPAFKTEQIVTEYLYMWIALGFMLILYVTMAMIVAAGAHEEPREATADTDSIQHSYQESISDGQDNESKAVARMLLLYPLVYGLSVVPMSITRWMQFNGHEIPYQATLFTTTIFSIAGLFNVVLFYLTRPEMVKGTNREMPPALPDTSFHFARTASPIAASFNGKDLSSPHSPPIRLRNIPSTSERDSEDADYGMPPL